ncbi:prepilin-type N-terminal cleavage/methylation domain-containing protein [bacterium]|nr:prepilin-type N-terminal cleavage/methylation domain-containing protein [bacterium]
MIDRDNRGFSFIELMVAMSIAIIAIFGIYSILMASKRNYCAQENITDMHQEARASIVFMAREMRNISTITAIDCTVNNGSITFTSIEEAGTATGSGSGTLSDTTKSWDVNAWQNYTCAIVNGPGTGQTKTITSNTANQLTVSPPWSDLPDNTSLYQIRSAKGFARDTSDNELDYTKNGTTRLFAENITGLTLQGYDSSGALTCTPANIRRLEISTTARTSKKNPNTHEYKYYTTKTVFSLRN